MNVTFSLLLPLAILLSASCSQIASQSSDATSKLRLVCMKDVYIVIRNDDDSGQPMQLVSSIEPALSSLLVLQPRHGWDFIAPITLFKGCRRVHIARNGEVTVIDSHGEAFRIGRVEAWRLPDGNSLNRNISALAPVDTVFESEFDLELNGSVSQADQLGKENGTGFDLKVNRSTPLTAASPKPSATK